MTLTLSLTSGAVSTGIDASGAPSGTAEADARLGFTVTTDGAELGGLRWLGGASGSEPVSPVKPVTGRGRTRRGTLRFPGDRAVYRVAAVVDGAEQVSNEVVVERAESTAAPVDADPGASSRPGRSGDDAATAELPSGTVLPGAAASGGAASGTDALLAAFADTDELRRPDAEVGSAGSLSGPPSEGRRIEERRDAQQEQERRPESTPRQDPVPDARRDRGVAEPERAPRAPREPAPVAGPAPTPPPAPTVDEDDDAGVVDDADLAATRTLPALDADDAFAPRSARPADQPTEALPRLDPEPRPGADPRAAARAAIDSWRTARRSRATRPQPPAAAHPPAAHPVVASPDDAAGRAAVPPAIGDGDLGDDIAAGLAAGRAGSGTDSPSDAPAPVAPPAAVPSPAAPSAAGEGTAPGAPSAPAAAGGPSPASPAGGPGAPGTGPDAAEHAPTPSGDHVAGGRTGAGAPPRTARPYTAPPSRLADRLPLDRIRAAVRRQAGLLGSGGRRDRADGEAPVNEIAIGEYDARFAYASLAVAGGLALLFFIVISAAAFAIPLGSVDPSTGGPVDVPFGDRVRVVVALFGLALGGAVALLGAWLAALETRGRLRAVIALDPDRGDGLDALGTDRLDALAAVLEKARRLRGAIAVIAAGAVIVVVSLWTVLTL